jgi:hypothetical protein
MHSGYPHTFPKWGSSSAPQAQHAKKTAAKRRPFYQNTYFSLMAIA